MIVVTYTYRETPGTQRMAESVKRQGYELAVVQAGMNPHDTVSYTHLLRRDIIFVRKYLKAKSC